MPLSRKNTLNFSVIETIVMGIKKLIGNYSAFNAWANTLHVQWLRTLDHSLLYKQMPSSFTSIDHTVQHILRVQKFWTAFVSGKEISDFNWSVYKNSIDSILTELGDQSDEMQRIFTAFTENELGQPLQLDTPWAKNELSRYEYILHVINHSTYHRGQIVTIARNFGVSEQIPATDYNFYNSRVPL